jgi:predicted nuclease of predicted toxin-antitoxin system
MLFDEQLPPVVPEALRVLGYNASWVGNSDGAPARGASDEDVLGHTKRTGQVVVTSNHDMILLCAEQAESVIWLDPRGRQFKRDEMVVLVFRTAAEWESLLAAATEPMCVRALRTKTEVLSLERAAHLVQQRMRRIAARKRRKARPKPLGPLLASANEDPRV